MYQLLFIVINYLDYFIKKVTKLNKTKILIYLNRKTKLRLI